MGLRDVGRDAHADLGAARILDAMTDGLGAGSREDDAEDIFVLLGGQTDHEIELHPLPAARKHALGRLHQLRFGDVFVDHIPHALRPSLGSKGEALGALRGHIIENRFAEAIGAERRNTEIDPFSLEPLDEAPNERSDGAIIRGR